MLRIKHKDPVHWETNDYWVIMKNKVMLPNCHKSKKILLHHRIFSPPESENFCMGRSIGVYVLKCL